MQESNYFGFKIFVGLTRGMLQIFWYVHMYFLLARMLITPAYWTF